MRLSCVLLLPLLAGISTAARVDGQSAQSPATTNSASEPAYSIRATTNSVVLDVVATDNKGNLAAGLSKERFRILEDGKPQTIDFFEPHVDVSPGAPVKSAKNAPGVYDNIPTTEVNGAVDILLVDSLNTELTDQVFVRQQLIEFLQTVSPGTRIAIFTLGSRLQMLQGFTSDMSVLQAVLNSKAGKAILQKPALLDNLEETANQNQVMQTLMDEADRADQSGQSGAALDLRDQVSKLRQFTADEKSFDLDNRVWMTLQALQAIARYLGVVRGRKNLIWLSGSFPVRVVPSTNIANLLPQTSLPDEFESVRDYLPNVQMTTNLLTKAQIAVYPMDAHGSTANPMFQASMTNFSVLDPTTPRPLNGAQNNNNFEQQQALDQSSMETLARETGGEAFYGTNGIADAVSRAIHHGSNYYTIAYTPTNKDADGKLRKIEIGIDQGKYKLFYHHSYFAETQNGTPDRPEQTPMFAFKVALTQGLPVATQIAFKVHAVPANPQPPAGPVAGDNSKLDGPTVRYSLDYAANLHGFKVKTTPDGMYEGTFILSAMAYDKKGKLLNSFGRVIPYSFDRAKYIQFLKFGMQIHEALDIPSGEVYLRTGFFDPASGNIGTLEIPLHVNPQVDQGATASSERPSK